MKEIETFGKKSEIFRSYLTLEYLNPKMEKSYQSQNNATMEGKTKIFINILLVTSYKMTIMICLLALRRFDKNIVWNGIFSFFNFILATSIYIFNNKGYFENSENLLFIRNLTIHVGFENIFISLISITLVYFKLGLDSVTILFLLQIITRTILSMVVHRRFINSFYKILLNFLFKVALLTSIHIIWAIIYYLILDFFISMMNLTLVYFYEYLTRKLFYSIFLEQKEKDDFFETIQYLNISYYKLKNSKIHKEINMKRILSNFFKYETDDIKSSEIFFNHLIELDKIPPCLRDYIKKSILNKSFSLEQFLSIFKRNEGSIEFFQKFNPVGVFYYKDKETNEKTYLKFYLKINSDKDLKNDILVNEANFEFLFYDISQLYLKTQNYKNSLLLAKLIHDLKSPLFLLNKMIKHFESKLFSVLEFKKEKELLEYSKNIHSVTNYIFEMIEGVNCFTKNQEQEERANTINKEFQALKIKKLIEECCHYSQIYLKYNTNKKQLKVSSLISESVPKWIKSNEVVIRQVIRNLLSNALKFTHVGEIKVECKLKQNLISQNMLEISVSDTGQGIKDSDIEKLGSPYLFSTKSLKDTEFGSGLGMSIIIDSLKELNSQLKINSKLNEGTTFSFDFPIEYLEQFEQEFPHINNDESHSESVNSFYSDKNDEMNFSSIIKVNSDDLKYMDTCPDIPTETIEMNKIKSSPHKTLTGLIKKSSNFINIVNITACNNLSYFDKSANYSDSIPALALNSYHEKNLKVLLIEDDLTYSEIFSNNIVKISKKMKIKITCDVAYDTIEGLGLIYKSIIERQKYYDVIFIDENMPFLLGTEFVKLYKDILLKNNFYEIKFVCSSGEKIRTNYEKYFFSNLSKPCKKNELSKLLNNILLL
jgi:signal transduction histidine kinase